MTDGMRAHVRLLESLPKERIRTHEMAVTTEPRQGVHRLITAGLVARYVELKKDGMKFRDIKRALRTSGRLMARLRKAARAA